MQTSAKARLDILIAQFHARKPIRAGSLIVSLFGDCIQPRGGSLWLGTLTDIMAMAGIEGGLVRTALSRLASDGLFAREKIGRNAYYRLSPEGRALFSGAERRIYEAHSGPWDGRLRLYVCDTPLSADERTQIESQNFGLIGNQWIIAAHDNAPPLPNIIALKAEAAAKEARALIARAYALAALQARYAAFISAYAPLHELMRDHSLDDGAALVLRLMLIHDYRRIVLRDPRLPPQLLPPDWPGLEARAITTALYHHLLPPSERWLNANGRNEIGALPPASAALARRFSAIQP